MLPPLIDVMRAGREIGCGADLGTERGPDAGASRPEGGSSKLGCATRRDESLKLGEDLRGGGGGAGGGICGLTSLTFGDRASRIIPGEKTAEGDVIKSSEGRSTILGDDCRFAGTTSSRGGADARAAAFSCWVGGLGTEPVSGRAPRFDRDVPRSGSDAPRSGRPGIPPPWFREIGVRAASRPSTGELRPPPR
ncbi:MAG: hypothetical protein ACRELY_05245 [Polyangiaceae bacterium]